MQTTSVVSNLISRYLPFWIVLLAIIAYIFPYLFVSIREFTGFGLGIIFLLMGMSLTLERLFEVIKNPKSLLVGVLLKWIVMVTVTIFLAFIFFSDQPEIATGIILAGTVPSGTSANVYTFIAGGEAALSITMATVDTIISPILTPALIQIFAGRLINISFLPLFLNIMYIVFLPLFLGLLLQWKFTKVVIKVRPYTTILSQLALFLIVLAVVSSAASSLETNIVYLPLILLAVFLQVSIPMAIGFFIARALKIKEVNAISILFHTGICNTALAATLAMEHVSSLAAVPAVTNMVVNLTLGAIIANFFSRKNNQIQTV
ncbi:MAG: bile acid:sodium symporter family protein [Psychrobacillus sp.]